MELHTKSMNRQKAAMEKPNRLDDVPEEDIPDRGPDEASKIVPIDKAGPSTLQLHEITIEYIRDSLPTVETTDARQICPIREVSMSAAPVVKIEVRPLKYHSEGKKNLGYEETCVPSAKPGH